MRCVTARASLPRASTANARGRGATRGYYASRARLELEMLDELIEMLSNLVEMLDSFCGFVIKFMKLSCHT